MSEPAANPYLTEVKPGALVDVYDVLTAFNVTCPATAHAVKKLLCAGRRGGGKNRLQDLAEAQQALVRAIDLEMGHE